MQTHRAQVKQISAMLDAARVLLLVEHSWDAQGGNSAYMGQPEDCLSAGIQLIGISVPMLAGLQASVSDLVEQWAPEKRAELDQTFNQLWTDARDLARAYESMSCARQHAQHQSLMASWEFLERLRSSTR